METADIFRRAEMLKAAIQQDIVRIQVRIAELEKNNCRVRATIWRDDNDQKRTEQNVFTGNEDRH